MLSHLHQWLNFIKSHNMFLYADNMLFLHPLKSSSDLATLNQHLQNVRYWLSLNSLSINLQKSKYNNYTIFSLCPQSYFDPLPPVKMTGTVMLIALPLHYLHFTKCWSTHSLSMDMWSGTLYHLLLYLLYWIYPLCFKNRVQIMVYWLFLPTLSILSLFICSNMGG